MLQQSKFNRAHFVCDGVVVVVVAGGAAEDPELATEERHGRTVDGVHLGTKSNATPGADPMLG